MRNYDRDIQKLEKLEQNIRKHPNYNYTFAEGKGNEVKENKSIEKQKKEIEDISDISEILKVDHMNSPTTSHTDLTIKTDLGFNITNEYSDIQKKYIPKSRPRSIQKSQKLFHLQLKAQGLKKSVDVLKPKCLNNSSFQQDKSQILKFQVKKGSLRVAKENKFSFGPRQKIITSFREKIQTLQRQKPIESAGRQKSYTARSSKINRKLDLNIVNNDYGLKRKKKPLRKKIIKKISKKPFKHQKIPANTSRYTNSLNVYKKILRKQKKKTRVKKKNQEYFVENKGNKGPIEKEFIEFCKAKKGAKSNTSTKVFVERQNHHQPSKLSELYSILQDSNSIIMNMKSKRNSRQSSLVKKFSGQYSERNYY